MHARSLLLTASMAISLSVGKKIPANVQAYYDSYVHGNSSNCEQLAGPFSAYYGGNAGQSMYYVKDSKTGAMFIRDNSGGYADMDIDCDGENASEGDCFNDPSGQSITAFQSTIEGYGAGINDLDAHIHPYVVLGNTGDSPSFHPQSADIRPLSVVAVVCNDQLHYGIWGDVNGGTVVGEASLSMGQLCFGEGKVDGNHGHTPRDVMYIAFPGNDAVPGADGAAWDAENMDEFVASIEKLGDSLVADL